MAQTIGAQLSVNPFIFEILLIVLSSFQQNFDITFDIISASATGSTMTYCMNQVNRILPNLQLIFDTNTGTVTG